MVARKYHKEKPAINVAIKMIIEIIPQAVGINSLEFQLGQLADIKLMKAMWFTNAAISITFIRRNEANKISNGFTDSFNALIIFIILSPFSLHRLSYLPFKKLYFFSKRLVIFLYDLGSLKMILKYDTILSKEAIKLF